MSVTLTIAYTTKEDTQSAALFTSTNDVTKSWHEKGEDQKVMNVVKFCVEIVMSMFKSTLIDAT